jgi:hypothetical protein
VKARLPQYKNKSFRARRRKAAQLYMYGDADNMNEALYMSWMTNSKWSEKNAARAFKRKGMQKEIRKIENAIALREAKTKTDVICELEENDNKIAKAADKVLDLVEDLAEKAGDDPEALKELTKSVNALKGLAKIRQDLGTRADKLQGRYVAEQKNPEDAKNDAITAMMLAQQKGTLQTNIRKAEAIDVETNAETQEGQTS